MTVSDYKMQIIKEIVNIENEDAIKEIYNYVRSFLEGFNEIEEEKTNPKISFEEWNIQFTDDRDLDCFIPEYGTTLREFRQGIYEAESGETISVNAFQQKLRKLVD